LSKSALFSKSPNKGINAIELLWHPQDVNGFKESGGFCEVRGAILGHGSADLIEAGLNEGAGDLRGPGLWGLYVLLATASDCSARWDRSRPGNERLAAKFRRWRETVRRCPRGAVAAILIVFDDPRTSGATAAEVDPGDAFWGSVMLAQIIEADLMTCRIGMAA
jgi:hypothetical protein